MRWLLVLAVVLVILYLRRDKRTPEQRLRDAYLKGDRVYLKEHLPPAPDWDAESWGFHFSASNSDRVEDGLEPLDFDTELKKAYFDARVEAYRKANPDLPWRAGR